MSNKITRKGITFGTVVAFTLSALVGVAPANALAASLPTIPAAGSTYESIRESGVWLKTTVTGGTTNDLSFRIQSDTPGLSTDQLWDMIVAGTVDVQAAYDEAGAPAHNSESGALGTLGLDCSLKTVLVNNGTTIIVSFVEAATFCTQDDDGDGGFNDAGDNTTMELASGSAVYLGIKADDSTTNQDLLINVRAHDDDNMDGIINGPDVASSVQSIKLYDSANVTATTAFETLAVGQQIVTSVTFNKPKLNTYFVTTYSQGNVVSSAAYNSTSTTVASAFAWSTYVPQVSEDWVDAENAKSDTSNVYNFPLEASTSAATVTVGNYAARASYNTDSSPSAGDWVTWLGNRTANSGLIAGANTQVSGVYATMTENANVVQWDEDEFYVRTGTSSATVTAQITKSDGDDSDLLRDDLEASNVRVKATFVSQYFNDEDTDITFSGSTIVMDEDREDVVLYGRTDSKGQASFTFTSSDPEAKDEIRVFFEVLNSSGVWVSLDDSGTTSANAYIMWADAWLYDFEVDPSGPVSGSSISLTYSAVDQFGEPMSTTGEDSEDAFVVSLFGTDGQTEQGTLNEDLLYQTKPLVNGRATFTFDNYASMDSFVWVTGILHQARDEEIDSRSDGYDLSGTEGYSYRDDWDRTVDGSSLNTQVFKNDATEEISSVDNEYSNVVTYQAFKAGNYTDDEDFFDYVNEDGLYSNTKSYISSEFATISGTVETKNGNGAVAQQVTITGSGLLFVKDRVDGYDEIHAIGSITVWTDVDGNFEVDVYSHKENLSGLSVSISSGGKSFTTKLVTYMNDDIDAGEYLDVSTDTRIDASVVTWNWNRVTGNAPSAKAQYLITITAKDVWGNLLRKADIDVYPNGWAEVGGARFDEIEEDDNYHGYTDANGKFTFTVEKGMWYWNIDDDTDDVDFLAAPSGNGGTIEADLYGFVYDLNGDGDVLDPNEFNTSSFDDGLEGVDELTASFKFGPQATAAAGTKKGVVRVNAYNVKGKTVKVFVAGKLVKTVVSDKAKFLTKVKGVKAGTKRVTVVVGKKRMYTGFVTVK